MGFARIGERRQAMRNIWRLFTGDVKRIGRNVVTVIIVLGLVLIPSLFSWYCLLYTSDAADEL